MHAPSSLPPSAATRTRWAALRFLLPGLAACLVASAPRGQGETGFLRGAGKTDVAVTYFLDTYDEFWVGGDRVSMPGVGEVDRMGYNLYAAYGLRDDLDLILSASYVEAESDGAAGAPDESDLQAAVLAAKWRVLRRQYDWGEVSFSLLPGVSLPLTDYENNAITAIGDGQIDWRGRIVGHIQTHGGTFASIETGYDHRIGKPKDEIPIHLTVGHTFANRFTLSPFLSVVESLGGTDIGPPGTNDFPTNEEDYVRTGLSAYYRLCEDVGITGSWRTTLDGRNTGDVEGFTLGLVFGF